MSNWISVVFGVGVLGVIPGVWLASAPGQEASPEKNFTSVIQPILKRYCSECHSPQAKKGGLDLERFATVAEVRRDIKPWKELIEQVEGGEMPPRGKPQPTEAEKKQLLAWIRGFLDSEARARAGDPGYVPLRRLSNAEYDATIRDLTGVDLRPTREFPVDGAAGEGFTNAAEALTDISPTLLTKYLNAAKEIARHAVLLPDGVRFSPGKTRRDWTDESLARLREFFAQFTGPDGRLPLQPYLLATVRHRQALKAGTLTPTEVATREKLNAKYLGILWQTLTEGTPSYPLDAIRSRWATATEKDVPALVAEVTAWQTTLWRFVPVGSYRYGNTVRQLPNTPTAVAVQPVRLPVKPPAGQSDVTIYLTARDLVGDGKPGHAVWQRPRFEGPGKPALLLSDYPKYGPSFEVDYPTVFERSDRYLAAVLEAAHDRQTEVGALARKHSLDAGFLQRWVDVLAVEVSSTAGRVVPTVPLVSLEEKAPAVPQKPAIKGWRKKGAELPVVVSNSSDAVEQIPGRVSPHRISAHPMPREFVAVVWKSPIAGAVEIQGKLADAHPTCGNGFAWWLEHRRGDRAVLMQEGAVALGGQASTRGHTLSVAKGDLLVLAVEARDSNHFCDMTEVELTLRQTEKPGLSWNLGAEVADSIHEGNPHGDRHGNREVWSFVSGPARDVGKGVVSTIPAGSILGRWRDVAADPKRREEAGQLAEKVRQVLSGKRPAKAQDPDGVLYDALVRADGPLFKGIDPVPLGKPRTGSTTYGLPADRFGRFPGGQPLEATSLAVPLNAVTEIKLPAALFQGRDLVVEGKVDGNDGRVVVFQASLTPPEATFRWDGKSPVVADVNSAGFRRLAQGYAEFQRCFPQFVCFPRIRPDDEVVCLKMFHREDDHLSRLFLDEEQQKTLDRLWSELRFISRQPVEENDYLPQFIGYVTQDQPKQLLDFFEGQRPTFQKRAEEFLKEEETARSRQMEALLAFAGRAYRRPLTEKEKADLRDLDRTLREKGISGEEAFRSVLGRVLIAPAFLFRIEQAHPGKEPGPINDWELASRLSYFLWSSLPDDELRTLAARGSLRDPQVLKEQTLRMLKDGRIRSLAVEFGTQWIHVRGFDEFNEKNEKLFPTFDANLRRALYEEAIRFFQDLVQSDRAVTEVLEADYTFLNETLAKHYGIPDVRGAEWRRVEGVRKYGRGGVLGLGAVQAKQAGASRTSPVLRGNWVVETLLGEKLPLPPANIPQLPEEEGAGGLTMRQQVERHARLPECAVCHVRVDPFGFALERYDPIGRLREKDLGGLPLDTRARLRDGTEFEGIDGLRTYLMTKKKDVVVRLFCQRLLGYALGRSVTLSDQGLLDEMVRELKQNEGKISAAILTIVRSPQFRMIRGGDYSE